MYYFDNTKPNSSIIKNVFENLQSKQVPSGKLNSKQTILPVPTRIEFIRVNATENNIINTQIPIFYILIS